MRGLVPVIVPVIVLVASLAACSMSDVPDPLDPPDDCGDPPGCTEDDCGLTCGGGKYYVCEDGSWHDAGYCEWCLFGVGADNARWTFDQAITAACPSTVAAPTHVVLDLMSLDAPDYYAVFTVVEPDTLAPTTSSWTAGHGYGTCSDDVTIGFDDVWTVDGVATPVSGTYTIVATGPGRLGADTTLDGTLAATVGGVDGCTVTGTVTGTWNVAPM